MAKKDKKNKKENKPTSHPASAIFVLANEEAKKIGERTYQFNTPNNEKAIFLVKATKGTNRNGEKAIRKTMSLNGKRITAQVARLMLDQIGRSMGEVPEGRKVAETQSALNAIKVWEDKNGSLMPTTDPAPDEKESDSGFTKKQKKTLLKKKAVKKALTDNYEKPEIKTILGKAFGESKIAKLSAILAAMQEVYTLTTDEETDLFAKLV